MAGSRGGRDICGSRDSDDSKKGNSRGSGEAVR